MSASLFIQANYRR